MDRITLRNIVVHGRHGAHPGERDRTQPFGLELSLDLDLTHAAKSDDLNDTVDYAQIHAMIVEIVANRSYALLERLAAEILGEICRDRRIVRAELSIAKPNLLDGATPSVTLVRERR